MAKLHKIELYLDDYNENFNHINDFAEWVNERCDGYVKISSDKSVEYDYDDDMDIRSVKCPIEVYENYFIKQAEELKHKQIRAFAKEICDSTPMPSDERVEEFMQSINSNKFAQMVFDCYKMTYSDK